MKDRDILEETMLDIDERMLDIGRKKVRRERYLSIERPQDRHIRNNGSHR